MAEEAAEAAEAAEKEMRTGLTAGGRDRASHDDPAELSSATAGPSSAPLSWSDGTGDEALAKKAAEAAGEADAADIGECDADCPCSALTPLAPCVLSSVKHVCSAAHIATCSLSYFP